MSFLVPFSNGFDPCREPMQLGRLILYLQRIFRGVFVVRAVVDGFSAGGADVNFVTVVNDFVEDFS